VHIHEQSHVLLSFSSQHDDCRCATISLVQHQTAGHDPATGPADRATRTDLTTPLPDLFESALRRLRLEGAIFLRAEYREPWAYESLPGPDTARILRPGTDRVILFHVVASGTCWVRVGDQERHWATAGDVIVLPYGDQHSMGGIGESEAVPLMTFMEAPPWKRMPLLRHGADGAQTDVVCGYLHSEDVLFDPALRVFPSAFVVRPSGPAGADWVRANIEYALAQAGTGPSAPDAIPTRLPEMLLVEVLRQHLATAPALDHGWLAALHDPVLNPAPSALHAAPERKWTVADLAAVAAVSRSGFDDRFRQVLGRSPIRYLTEWRMHLAQDLLASTDLSVAAISRRVGYDAEEAFSRAFKRTFGTSPGLWRADHAVRRH
jgi:AraC-like DNA-binding protein